VNGNGVNENRAPQKTGDVEFYRRFVNSAVNPFHLTDPEFEVEK
jgi:hypothetical protein